MRWDGARGSANKAADRTRQRSLVPDLPTNVSQTYNAPRICMQVTWLASALPRGRAVTRLCENWGHAQASSGHFPFTILAMLRCDVWCCQRTARNVYCVKMKACVMFIELNLALEA